MPREPAARDPAGLPVRIDTASARSDHSSMLRHWLPVAAIAAGLALVSFVVLAGLLALTGTPGWAHMGSMMATMGTMSGCH